MSIVRAFVGHSFTEGDKTLNDTFLEFLNQIKEMGIGFTWEHAKAAEPRELAEKVMNLIQDKNLFIGICTKKERVIGPNELERCWTGRKLLKSHESKFLWKTSDWILQEIGLAVGQKMDLILLIEEGLRPPGGLQGNIEYIEFSRSSPQGSFGKLLEMIRVLLPKVNSALTRELETESPENVMQNQRKEEDDNWWLEPKTEWDYDIYRFALIESIVVENLEAESRINSAFLKSPIAQTPNGLASWTAFGQYYHLWKGKDGSLETMEQLAKKSPEVGDVQFYLGRAYEIYKDYQKAGQAYVHAAGQATDTQDRLYNLGEAVKAYSRGGIKSEAESICESIRQEVLQSGEGEKKLVEALREVAGINSDMDIYYALSERLLELNPGDTDTRFNLAYKYSQGKEEKLSLFHYLRIPNGERSGGTWNNLGVQYDHFQIVSSSVKAYRKAEQAGETLAMSNIASKLIQSGFLAEAEEICKKAMAAKDYHKNVNHSMARIKEIPEEDTKKEDAIVKEAAPYSDFYKAYGKALCKGSPIDCTGSWEGPKCRLSLKIQGQRFNAEGNYEFLFKNHLRGLLNSALYLGAGAMAESSGKRVVKYVGTLSGHAITGLITEESEGDQSASAKALLDGLASRAERHLLMVVSESLDEIRVYDKDAPEADKLYILRKIVN
ncbi:MAG: hypothetical protein M0T82_13915 [Desulfobacteraceae bacterium]|nr:hypothetical protein [Desulfobacteraceae bacterium]